MAKDRTRGHLLEGFKTDRKAKRYANGVIRAVSTSGRKLYPSYVEALIGAAYYNGHQSGEAFQIGQAYPTPKALAKARKSKDVK